MSPTPKTIQIFLPGGDPRGIRIAEITTRIVQVIEAPTCKRRLQVRRDGTTKPAPPPPVAGGVNWAPTSANGDPTA